MRERSERCTRCVYMRFWGWGGGIKGCNVTRGAASAQWATRRRLTRATSLLARSLVLARRGRLAGATLVSTSLRRRGALAPSRVLPLPAPSPFRIGTSRGARPLLLALFALHSRVLLARRRLARLCRSPASPAIYMKTSLRPSFKRGILGRGGLLGLFPGLLFNTDLQLLWEDCS